MAAINESPVAMKTSNTEKPCVVATIPVGPKPVGVAVDVHDHVFVTNSGASTVSVINSVTNTVSATLNVGFFPESVATDPQFGVYVANGGNFTVSALDRFHALVATIFVGGPPGPPPPDMLRVAVDHFISRAYVANRGLDRVSIIGISSDPPALSLDFTEVEGPLGVAVDPVSHRVFVTRPDHNKVSVIDATTHGVIGSIPVGQHPTGIAIDPQKRRVYVANSGFKTVSVIDMATGGVAEIDVGASPTGVAVDSHGAVYVTHSDGLVRVIDPGSASVTARIPVGSQPRELAFEPHSNRVYVANHGDGTVSAIDLAGG
ncbi:YncE family protein [Streptomyces virginiae]|uniref:YncE family protein n=1 Tax=Streptomyces virginiae TaxID=1961 RepID=A0ABZ1TNN7_STRVG|nr:YncE family protein [Streptomyces virginiae]